MPNLLINAGPGCGKTHTMIDAYSYYRTSNPPMWLERFVNTSEQATIYDWIRTNIPPGAKTIYMAYNTPIKDELVKKIHTECEARTFHGWGYKLINKEYGYVPINYKRDQIIVEKITGQNFNSLRNRSTWWKSIKYMEKIKEELLSISEDSLYYLNQKYNDLVTLPPESEMLVQLTQLKDAMRHVDRKVGITYIDQVWLGIGLCTSPIYDLGFVDEGQDLSPARLMLAQRLCKHLVFAADQNQAINAFSGADPYSYEKILATCNLELPLKETFRLPPNHVTYANNLRPTAQLRPSPGKKDGEHNKISFSQLVEVIKPILHRKPLLLCRYNAPIVKASLALVKAGIPVRSLGDTLIGQLITMFKSLKATSLESFERNVCVLEARLTSHGSPTAQEQNQDRIDCLRYVVESCPTIADFEPTLKSLLKPTRENHVLASTVHKAKGLESPEVFLLFPPMSSSRAVTPDQITQEQNVNFVSHTRTSCNKTEIHA